MKKREMIADQRARKADAIAAMDALISRSQRENRSLTDAERQRFDELEADAKAHGARAEELEEQQRMNDADAPMALRYAPGAAARNNNSGASMPTASARITSEPAVYRKDSKEASFFLDAYAVSKNNSPEARERLDRNARQVADVRRQEGRALSTTNGNAGEFVPPMWMEKDFVRLARPRRVTADVVQNSALPPGTDVLNIPKVSTGTATALQATQNTGIQQTDMTTTSISSNVLTVAGGQTVSLQLAEQSPLNIDTVILGDLAADLAVKIDTQVLSGSGSGGNATGILTLAGTGSVSFTGTDGKAFQQAILKAIGQVFASRFEAPDVLILAPRRAVWLMAQQDSTGRPLLVPADNGPTNSMGVLAPKLATEGPIGRFCGLDVYVDSNIPTNLGAGTNEDRAIVMRSEDVFLWESTPKFEVFPQTYAQQLSLFARTYEYISFQAGRYPGAISILSGTGMSTTL
ncbi:phage major capsid protein [Streptomyces sp. NPDC001222]|uniref:phage major capsid protein n=1 Tax=Streptomyces sp. NPDC001222 TaxID=3364548 RepID=UPI0036955D3D